MRHISITVAIAIIALGCPGRPPHTDIDAGTSVADAGTPTRDGGFAWGDGGVRLLKVDPGPRWSCDDHCASIGGLCRRALYKAEYVASVFDYGACEQTNHECETAPSAQVVCSRPDPDSPPVFHSLVAQYCPCMPETWQQVPDGGIGTDAGPAILTGPTGGTLAACAQVCGNSGKVCALHKWDFREPSHGLLEYGSCTLLASCEEVPSPELSCFGSDEQLTKQSCACM